MEDCNKSFNKDKNNKIAFVFSCPGQKEEKENKPVAGATGDNLEYILTKIINEPYKDRYDFRIVNSSEIVYYKGKNGRTEDTSTNIKKVENINRIERELEGIEDYIIFFGKKAQYVKKYLNLKLQPKLIDARHLSPQSINKIKVEGKTPKERKEKRLNYIAEEIKKNMK